MVKIKKKQQASSTKIARPTSRLWLVGGLIILAICLALGTSIFIKRAARESSLARLPEIPDLTDSNEVLRKKLTAADHQTREALHAGRPDEQFGRMTGELGRLYQANHYYDQAILCYQLAMEFDSGNPHWPYLLASVQQQRGENESIRGLLKRTIELAPTYSPAMLKLADSYFKTGKMDEAKTYYKRRLNLSPKDPYALLGLARIALDRSAWQIAERHLEKAIESNQEFGDAHRLIATVHEHFGRTEKMKQALDQAAKCLRFRPAPDARIDALEELCYDTEQLLVLGSKAIAELDMKTAISKFYRRAIELDPENPKAHLEMGKALFTIGQREQAREFLKKTIELDRKSDEGYFQLALILRAEGKLKEAENLLLKALEFQANNPNVHNNLGVTLLEQGRFQEAAVQFNQALAIYPEHINALYNLGMSLQAMGRIQEAIEQYRRVLRIKPKWGTAANSLAWVLATHRNERIRNADEAIKWALKACEDQGRENPEYLDTLAAAYAEAGLFEKAVQTAQESLILAKATGDAGLVEELEHRLQLYRKGEAFHQ